MVAWVLMAASAGAAEDAAVKAREGEIGHWIEYYRRERTIESLPRSTPREIDGRATNRTVAPSAGQARQETAPQAR
ncbi:MAG TPA: hypothetical protein VNM24_08780 [Burkholderiales bacterium]|jgi:hypothetical protein|nr:hypothetical protein [Burkholderiales bacterium]